MYSWVGLGTEVVNHDLNYSWGRGAGVRGQPEGREPGSLPSSSVQFVSSVICHLLSSKAWGTSRAQIYSQEQR